MNDFRVSRLTTILEVALLPISIAFIILFFYVALSRVDYPFELNWMEGGVSSVVERIMAGQSIYAQPSLEYVPFTDTPLYYLLTSLIANLAGHGFIVLRSVSIVSTFFCFLLIYLFVKHETKSAFLGILSAGLFAAFYNVSGGWMDLGRIDSFSLFILLSALFVIRFYRNNKSYLAGGILLFLAFFANQFSIILIIFILGYGVIYNRRSILPVLLSSVVLIIASTFIMDKFYDNWYSYFVINLPLNFEISKSNIFLFWTEGLFRVCMVPIGFIIYNIYSNFKSGIKQWGWGFNMFAGAGMILMAWFLVVSSGSMENALLPAYAVIAILFGTSLNEILKKFKGKPGFNVSKLKDIIYILAILQFVSLIYDPGRLIPSREDRTAGEKFIESISKEDGDIFIPSHGYLAAMAGKRRFSHEKAIYDVCRNGNDEAAAKLTEQIKEAFANEDFAAVVYDDFYSPVRRFDVDSNYVFERYMFTDDVDFFPVVGKQVRPQYLFGRKQSPMDYYSSFEMIGPMPLPPEE